MRGSVQRHTGWTPENIQVVTVSINDRECFTGFVYADEGDPAAPNTVMRSPILDVGSSRALALAKEHIDECVHGHEHCLAHSTISPPLPTRLIDCTDPSHPYLASTDGQSGQYLTLSYVWGGDQVHKTTKINLSAYERGIDPSLLPQTIRDAIYITHALGFQLLWVDSLCIIQDSDEDKRRELGRMHDVYRLAHLTIIAANAERVGDGFLQERPPPPQMNLDDLRAGGDITLPFICPPGPQPPTDGLAETPPVSTPAALQIGTVHITPFQIHGSALDSSPHSSRDIVGPISTRAWCMQEYLMSPRALIFTPRTLQFRCLTSTRNVGDSLWDQLDDRRIPDALFLPEPPPIKRCSKEWDDVHGAWLEVVEDYSCRTASHPLDKLVACGAVAEVFHRVLRSDYLAGLWRDALIGNLLWAKRWNTYLRRPDVYRAPSWSWASDEGEITANAWRWSYEFLAENALAKVVQCEVVLEDKALPFGRVTGGSLVLHGTLLRCLLRPHMLPGYHTLRLQTSGQALAWHRTGFGGLSDEEEVDLDALLSGVATIDCEDVESRIMWAVPLLLDKQGVKGLVVALADEPDPGRQCAGISYRRIGQFSFRTAVVSPGQAEGAAEEAARRLGRDLKNAVYCFADIEIV